MNGDISTKVKEAMNFIILPIWLLLNLKGSGAHIYQKDAVNEQMIVNLFL
jgi:hypothetical protein